MQILQTRYLTDEQFQNIHRLWNEEYPVKLKDRFGLLLNGVDNYMHYLIEDENNTIVAWAVHFEKDNETRFSIIVSEKQQGKGLGTALVNKLKEDVNELYGWVIDHNNDIKQNGEHYLSPIPFYLKHGFEILPTIRIDNDMLNAVKIKRGLL